MSSTIAIPCRICNTFTLMTGTKLCDRCWHLKREVSGAHVDHLIHVIKETRTDKDLKEIVTHLNE